MKRVLLAAFLLLSQHAGPASLSAQANSTGEVRPGSVCVSSQRDGGPQCAPDHRLLIIATVNGTAPSPEILSIIDMASSAGGAFMLLPPRASHADSSIYAVLAITRDANRNFHIEMSTAGAAAKTATCGGSVTGNNSDMGFAAQLALEIQQLVRCVQHARGAPTPQIEPGTD